MKNFSNSFELLREGNPFSPIAEIENNTNKIIYGNVLDKYIF